MHTCDLILTLTGGLSAARVLGDVTPRVGLSPITTTTAGSLILTSAGTSHGVAVIPSARERNPGIRSLTRAADLRDVPALRQAAPTAPTRWKAKWPWPSPKIILDTLGATPEPIDRARACARRTRWRHRRMTKALLLSPLHGPAACGRDGGHHAVHQGRTSTTASIVRAPVCAGLRVEADMQFDASTVFILLMTAVCVGLIAWAEVRLRRRQRDEKTPTSVIDQPRAAQPQQRGDG